MASAKKAGRPWLLAVIAAVEVLLTAVLLLIRPPASLGWLVIRVASLLGYQTMFLVIVSSAYLRQMLRWFGRPFLKVHHLATLVGLALITLHPIAVVLQMAAARLLLPQFQSLRSFFQYGGAPALYLFVVAALVAVCRKSLGNNWRLLHMLAYLGFAFATLHAIMLGEDFAGLALRAVAVAMLAVVVYVAVERRRQARKRQAKK
ncbi:MAG: hypothetical protein ACYC5O_04975 [Anaerolineae bacterium]